MKSLLLLTSAICLITSAPAWANPVQIGNKGSASQVYGDGSAASSSHANASVGDTTGIGIGGAGGRGGAGGQGGNVGNVSGGRSKASVTVNISNPASGGGTGSTTGDTAPATGKANRGDSGRSGSRHANRESATTSGGSNGSGNGGGGYSGPSIPVASAVAPTVMSYNSCAGSAVSGAVQTGGVGISFGSGNKFDRVCWLNESGRPDAAIEYICIVDKTAREAMKHTAHPCAEDVQQVTTTSQTVYGHDWCYTRDAGNARQAEECDHPPVTVSTPVTTSQEEHRGFFDRIFN